MLPASRDLLGVHRDRVQETVNRSSLLRKADCEKRGAVSANAVLESENVAVDVGVLVGVLEGVNV